jgi:hypothetical protein
MSRQRAERGILAKGRDDCYNKRLYRQCNCIGRVLGDLKINRAIATRYDQLVDSFLGMLYLASVTGSNLSTRPRFRAYSWVRNLEIWQFKHFRRTSLDKRTSGSELQSTRGLGSSCNLVHIEQIAEETTKKTCTSR